MPAVLHAGALPYHAAFFPLIPWIVQAMHLHSFMQSFIMQARQVGTQIGW